MANDYAMSTKARSLFSMHLTQEQFQNMTRLKDVSSVAAYLKTETRYADALEGIHENSVHREVLEQCVRKQSYIEFIALMRYMKHKHTNFYTYYTKRVEIEQILYVLHSIESHVSHHVEYYVEDLKDYLSIDVNALARCTSFEMLDAFFKNTPYSDVLSELLNDSEVDISRCEDALNAYYRVVFKEIVGKEPNKKEIQQLFDVNDELSTVAHIYRLKKFYHAKPENIIPRLNYQPYLIPHRIMVEWVEQLDADEFMQAFHNSAYSKYIESPHITDIELHLSEIKVKIIRHHLRFATNTNLTLISYMALLEIEIKNIIDVIEGVRYQMPSDAIMNMLTR